jgi:hypothetical protein
MREISVGSKAPASSIADEGALRHTKRSGIHEAAAPARGFFPGRAGSAPASSDPPAPRRSPINRELRVRPAPPPPRPPPPPRVAQQGLLASVGPPPPPRCTASAPRPPARRPAPARPDVLAVGVDRLRLRAPTARAAPPPSTDRSASTTAPAPAAASAPRAPRTRDGPQPEPRRPSQVPDLRAIPPMSARSGRIVGQGSRPRLGPPPCPRMRPAVRDGDGDARAAAWRRQCTHGEAEHLPARPAPP